MQSLKTQIRHGLSAVTDTILPPRCLVTGDIVERQGMLSASAWAELAFIADPFCRVCGVPFEFETVTESELQDNTQCASCLDHPPHFDRARGALAYNDISRKLILGFKHGDKTHAVLCFMPWLLQAGRAMIEESDIIIPVPLHRKRLIARRYNQAAILVQHLARDVDKPFLLDGLKRIRETVSQGFMSAKDRKKNVRSAFAVPDFYKPQIEGRNILVIDDVYTTGATVNECAKALKKAGAAKVQILTLARVVRN